MVPNGDPGGWNPLPDKTKLSKFNSFSLIKFVKVGIFSIKTWVHLACALIMNSLRTSYPIYLFASVLSKQALLLWIIY